ncbi:thioredoxin domain-containing protein isoform X2 [Pseudomyrmex gracilis]|uniref:thioredoxin domain-containing protein isoform X2 n=1 Tax=Pseudomyrmex gracilis TaxID=219809 RepID=UPI0009952356|nr:thioredoxin domain-containing protein isoform X2 [Pseudomyrmex gracilis]
MLRLVFLVAICVFSSAQAGDLETVNDEELLNLIKTENYVVVLFTKKDCPECENYENTLIQLREDLVDSLSAWIVKTFDSQLLQLYSTDKEPVLLFFRHGLPLLYDGSLNEEMILTMFAENKLPGVKELTDDTFEHLTQASSGATTGDWFIMFYSTDCAQCLRMIARWETVAAKLRQTVNVALINKSTTGAYTARRFHVYDTPQFILFRHGKMYRYDTDKYDIKSLVSFAKEWYRNVKAEKVPVPQSPFDDLTQRIANFIRDNPWILKLSSICIGILVVITAVSKLKQKPETPQKKDK